MASKLILCDCEGTQAVKADSISGACDAACSKVYTALCTRQLEAAQKELIESAHRAGMADIATSVLHNVGNTLNSVVISYQVCDRVLRNSRLRSFDRANTALRRFVLPEWNEEQPKLPQLMDYYEMLI